MKKTLFRIGKDNMSDFNPKRRHIFTELSTLWQEAKEASTYSTTMEKEGSDYTGGKQQN